MARLLRCAWVLILLGYPIPAHAELQMKAGYSAPANLFSLMDNLSQWMPGFTDAAYRDEWVRRFGWSKSDQAWVDRYSEYRRRTYSDPSQGELPATSADGMFAPAAANTAASDPLAAHLLAQPSLASALQSLASLGSPTDARMLKGFYGHFAPKWRAILAESSSLATNAKLLNDQLNGAGVSAFVARAAHFYRVSVTGKFQALFVWYPPGRRSSAEVAAGRYFLIHVPPGRADSNDWDAVAMHELMHYMSAHQTAAQKQALTQNFLARCPQANRPKALRLLEEPLAVAWGQAAYAKFAASRPLKWSESWYAIPQVDLLGHMLWPSVDQLYNSKATLTDGIVDQAAKHCATLFEASKALQPN